MEDKGITMEDKGIDMIMKIDFERRAKYLQSRFLNLAENSITKEKVYEAFKNALDKQAVEKDSDSKVTKISLDGAENKFIFIKNFTKDFLELPGQSNFRLDVKLKTDADSEELISLEFTFASRDSQKNY